MLDNWDFDIHHFTDGNLRVGTSAGSGGGRNRVAGGDGDGDTAAGGGVGHGRVADQSGGNAGGVGNGDHGAARVGSNGRRGSQSSRVGDRRNSGVRAVARSSGAVAAAATNGVAAGRVDSRGSDRGRHNRRAGVAATDGVCLAGGGLGGGGGSSLAGRGLSSRVRLDGITTLGRVRVGRVGWAVGDFGAARGDGDNIRGVDGAGGQGGAGEESDSRVTHFD
jgi:hypothetical protein